MTDKTPRPSDRPGSRTATPRDDKGMPPMPAKPVSAENQETRGEKDAAG